MFVSQLYRARSLYVLVGLTAGLLIISFFVFDTRTESEVIGSRDLDSRDQLEVKQVKSKAKLQYDKNGKIIPRLVKLVQDTLSEDSLVLRHEQLGAREPDSFYDYVYVISRRRSGSSSLAKTIADLYTPCTFFLDEMFNNDLERQHGIARYSQRFRRFRGSS